MTEFIYKVAPRGEGKTKWLLNQAKNELDAGEKVVLLANEANKGLEYKIFAEKYFGTFHEVCKVDTVNHIHQIPHDGIVLIDSLFMLDMHMNAVTYLIGQCKRVYITLDGKLAPSEQRKTVDPNQLSIFDTMSDRS